LTSFTPPQPARRQTAQPGLRQALMIDLGAYPANLDSQEGERALPD